MDAWPKTRRKISDNAIPGRSEPGDQKGFTGLPGQPSPTLSGFLLPAFLLPAFQ
ncbi:hypothetical protein [Pseudomonas chlororaphis]|uniref:hypothetical protein n=1 Tax=Pseudomonas chlororaphis TaxID=587753 RepID=UPI00131A526B|nr:hypothetical protein [Pseudomonas chlororaphis]WMJ01885.1 hypothetical protein RBU55_10090 [Pseudomonas chlororaphis subsp. aurantiaca]